MTVLTLQYPIPNSAVVQQSLKSDEYVRQQNMGMIRESLKFLPESTVAIETCTSAT